MNEEELIKRSEQYSWEYSGNISAFNEAEQRALAAGYVQGALDQDPISRKARTKEILDFLDDQISTQDMLNTYGDEMYEQIVHLIKVKFLNENPKTNLS
jgi:hypothetical protein